MALLFRRVTQHGASAIKTLWIVSLFCAVVITGYDASASDLFAGRNANIIGPPAPGSNAFADIGQRQQNEPSCAINPENPLRMCCGFNDYRGIDIPQLGDAWEGIACSTDGGDSWNSQLIPGHRADEQYSLGLEFAADPNLVSVPGGLVFNYIAANRDQVGGLYVQLYAWLNKEDGWPIEPVGGPRLVSKGTSGRFIDKPHAFGYLYEDGETVTWEWSGANGPQTLALPSGNLVISAAIFTGNDNNDSTKINLWTSNDWGFTWNQPTKLTESKGINSGINLAANGENVCAVWRRFDDNNEANSIFQACSTNNGRRFTKAKEIADICPFDLVTLNGEEPTPGIVSLRSNTFPVIAADGSNFYAFWTDRGYAQASNGAAGCSLSITNPETGELEFNPSFGRIVYAVSANEGKSWTFKGAVEDVSPSTNSADPTDYAPTDFPGHQFMPAAYGAGQEVLLTWIDTRNDQLNRLRNQADPAVDKQLIVDLWDTSPTPAGSEPAPDLGLWRHSADIRAIKLSDGEVAAGSQSVQVSRYAHAFLPGKGVTQVKYNLINARLFLQGTAPFAGDYLNVAAPPYVLDPQTQEWKNSNSPDVSLPGSSTFRVTWTDNRDLFGPLWGSASGFGDASPYTPAAGVVADGAAQALQETGNNSVGVQDPPSGPQVCVPPDPTGPITPRNDRTRDQNVYSAAVYPQFTMNSPGAIKLSGAGLGTAGTLQRAIPVVVQNHDGSGVGPSLLELEIIDIPSGGTASFSQYDSAVHSVPVLVWPNSSAVRTVFVSSAAAAASKAIRVNARSGASAVARVVLNEDPLQLQQPDSAVTSVLAQETHDPSILNPAVLNQQLVYLLLAEAQGNPASTGPLLSALINTGYLAPGFTVADLFNLAVVDNDLLSFLLGENCSPVNGGCISNAQLLDQSVIDAELLSQIIQYPQLLSRQLLVPGVLSPGVSKRVLLHPDLLNPQLWALVVANPAVFDPSVLTPDVLNTLVNDPANPAPLNQALLNLIIENPDVLNPDVLNLLVSNGAIFTAAVDALAVTSPESWAELLNILVSNPNILNPDVLNPDVLNTQVLNTSVINGLRTISLDENFPVNGTEAEKIAYLNANLTGVLEANVLAVVLANPDVLNPDVLNPDILNPDVLNPDILNPDVLNVLVANPDVLNPDILNPDVLNPNILNPNILNPDILNPDVLNPDVLNPDVLNPDVLNPDLLNFLVLYATVANPDVLNPDVLNPDVLNPDILNPDILNPDVLNPDILNPDVLNPDILNPDVLNPDVLNPDVLNAAPQTLSCSDPATPSCSLDNPEARVPEGACAVGDCDDDVFVDMTWQVKNDGNTTTGYTAQSFVAGAQNDPAITGGQVIVSKPYLRPTTVNCLLDIETTNNVVVNVPVPVKAPPVPDPQSGEELPYKPNPDLSALENAALPSFWLAPGEIANVTLRVFGPDYETLRGAKILGRAGVYISSEACTTGVSAGSCNTAIPFALIDVDSTPPTFGDLTDFYEQFIAPFEAQAPEGVVISYELPPASDDGGVVSVACELPPDMTFPMGYSTHTCTATDSAGNETPLTFNVWVLDTTAPTIDVSQNSVGLPVAVEQSGPAGVEYDFAPFKPTDSDPGWRFSATDSVDVDPVLSCLVRNTDTGEEKALNLQDGVINGSLLLSAGSWLLECTATDDGPRDEAMSVNSVTQVIGQILVVADTTPPVLQGMVDIIAEAESAAGAPVAFNLPTATDAVSGSLPVSCGVTPGDTFPLGDTLVICSASDDEGNEGTGSFTVTVQDTTAPTLVTPTGVTLEAESPAGATLSYQVGSASDLVSGNILPTCTPASGATVVGIGESVTVVCSASDAAGNQTVKVFAVTTKDTVSPVLQPLPDLVREANDPAGRTGVSFIPEASDSADSVVAVACTVSGAPVDPAGDTYGFGDSLVICTATDDSGNTDVENFTVTVEDTVPPLLTVPEGISLPATDISGAFVSFAADVSATDQASSAVDISCEPPSDSLFPVGATEVSCIATDAQGLTAEASFPVNVGVAIVWISPELTPGVDFEASVGPNLGLAWGYGLPDNLFDSRLYLERKGNKGTDPLLMTYLGQYLGGVCAASQQITVDLDAGNSSLRYRGSEWLLNWQTGQSLLDTDGDGEGDSPLQAGCYELQIPREDTVDTRRFILN